MQYDSTIRFTEEFYSQNAKKVAKQLLGCCLIVQANDELLSGWIVETEAYLDKGDPACHAARGRTRSNASIFGPPGLLYVYPIHAKYCMNVVTAQEGIGQAVLIRAIQPLSGIERMVQATGRTDLRMLARGPARLCQALSVDRSWDGLDLVQSKRIWISPPATEHSRVSAYVRAAGLASPVLTIFSFVFSSMAIAL